MPDRYAPIPTRLKLIRGNPGHRPLNKNEPMPVGDLTDAPEWLTESQKDCWRYAIEHAPNGLLKYLDSAVLTIWAIASDTHRQAAEKLAQHGLLVKTPITGLPIQSPYLPIVNKQAQIMLKAAAEMGFTPSSRSRISVESTVSTSKYAALSG